MLKSSLCGLALALAGICGIANAQDAAAGKAKAERCAACHGADGNSTVGTYPSLAGQTARYLYLQLRDFKEGARKDPVMSAQLEGLNKQDFFDLAAYFAAQPLKPINFKIDQARVERGRIDRSRGPRNPRLKSLSRESRGDRSRTMTGTREAIAVAGGRNNS